MPKHFLFLEILDRDINALLTRLQEEFGSRLSKTNTHLTVRGPFPDPIPTRDIERFQRAMEGDTLLIAGVGKFDNADAHIVYLKINSANLKSIWFKPDYPIETHGFNPHISLYRGQDSKLAECIHAFLEAQKIELLCHDFRLSTYVTEQLFPPEREPTERQFLTLVNRRKVKPNILQLAANVVRDCKKQSAHP